MAFFNKSESVSDENNFPSAIQAKKLTTLSFVDKQREIKKRFNLWLEENKKTLRKKIIEACSQGKDFIIYQNVPVDYEVLFINFFNELGYIAEYDDTDGTNCSICVSWRY